MPVETFTNLLVLTGVVGLACWFIAILDGLTRVRTLSLRSRHHDRVNTTLITVGSLFVVTFVAGLYYLVSTPAVR